MLVTFINQLMHSINTFAAGYLNTHRHKNAGRLKGPQPLLS